MHVILPWGGLLSGIVTANPETIQGLAYLGRNGATLRVVLNRDAWEQREASVTPLPEPTPEYVAKVLAPRFAEQGIDVIGTCLLAPDEAARIGTTWAKRLRHGRAAPRWLEITARYTKRPT